ncbi:hypothetical protein NLN82_22535 [Citrobacter portucalensis]|uniref:hypothetical protein n=1 Tax=Citrobacter portucalensis TaxID=1639133 RepID=UPI00226B45A9|nr:hypothetical protein [Citrobacter portucalensis]MCX9038805.1 hypothetical protein [Citrobacter portucalensis]
MSQKSILARQAAASAPLQSTAAPAPLGRETFDTSLKGVPVSLKARWKTLKDAGRVHGSFTAFLLEAATARLDELERR